MVVDLVLLAKCLETTDADTTETCDTDMSLLVKVVIAMAIRRLHVVFGTYEASAVGSRSFSIKNSVLFLFFA